jgi:hypothetical protein
VEHRLPAWAAWQCTLAYLHLIESRKSLAVWLASHSQQVNPLVEKNRVEVSPVTRMEFPRLPILYKRADCPASVHIVDFVVMNAGVQPRDVVRAVIALCDFIAKGLRIHAQYSTVFVNVELANNNNKLERSAKQ